MNNNFYLYLIFFAITGKVIFDCSKYFGWLCVICAFTKFFSLSPQNAFILPLLFFMLFQTLQKGKMLIRSVYVEFLTTTFKMDELGCFSLLNLNFSANRSKFLALPTVLHWFSCYIGRWNIFVFFIARPGKSSSICGILILNCLASTRWFTFDSAQSDISRRWSLDEDWICSAASGKTFKAKSILRNKFRSWYEVHFLFSSAVSNTLQMKIIGRNQIIWKWVRNYAHEGLNLTWTCYCA